jgi:O-antigen ligase/Flp pilus assembly protein TadD
VPAPSLAFDRTILAAAVVLTAVLFTARLADPVNIIKMTALVLCAIVLLASCTVRAVRTRVVQLPWGVPAAVALALLAAFVVATVTAPVTTTAVLGAYGRNSGLLVYASALVLFLVGLRIFDRSGTRVILYALMLAGAFTASYGLLQFVGLDSVPWNNPFNPIIAALGNPNFAAAYLAICTPAAAWGALRTDWGLPWRALSAVLATMCLLAALLSNAAQGPLAAAPGLAVLGVAWLLDRPAKLRRVGLAAVGTGTTLGLLVLGAGVAGAGPAAGVFSDIGSRARGWYWEVAFTIWRDRPVFGVGLDNYGSFWRTARPLEATRSRGGEDFSDAAHNVPLQLLSTGGLLLGLTYLAFVAVAAVALVLGLRRLRGQERLLLGALGGCWTAYQVQSFVSIDQVPLIVTQYVLAAGVVVAAGSSRLRELRLPGALPPPEPTENRKRRAPVIRPRPRALTPADYVLIGVVGLAALALSWQATVPLRANAAVLTADSALARGDGSAALAAYDRATGLVPGEPRYWQKRGQLFQQVDQPENALASFRRAVAEDPFDVTFLRQAAPFAEAQGQVDEARELHRRALELDPNGPKTVVPAAVFELRHDGAEQALELMERFVQVLPGRAEAWATLGDARATLADAPGAREAYDRALQLEPGQPAATAGLAMLAPAPAA